MTCVVGHVEKGLRGSDILRSQCAEEENLQKKTRWGKEHVGKGTCGERNMWGKEHVGKGMCGERNMWGKEHVGKGMCREGNRCRMKCTEKEYVGEM